MHFKILIGAHGLTILAICLTTSLAYSQDAQSTFAKPPTVEWVYPHYTVYEPLPISPLTMWVDSASKSYIPIPALIEDADINSRPLANGLIYYDDDWLMQSYDYVVQVGTYYFEDSLNKTIELYKLNNLNFKAIRWLDREHGHRYSLFYAGRFKNYQQALSSFASIQSNSQLPDTDFWIRNVEHLKSIRCRNVANPKATSENDLSIKAKYCTQ